MNTETAFEYEENLAGKRFAFFGHFSHWPSLFLDATPQAHVQARLAMVVHNVDADLDYLVVGDGREKGRADAIRQAQKLRAEGDRPKTLDEREFLHLVRPKIAGKSFAVAGGFSQGGLDLDDGPGGLLARYGVTVREKVCADLDFLVIGERRAKGKTAVLRQAETLRDQGAPIRILREHELLDWLACLDRPEAQHDDFRTFAARLRHVADPRRVDRALQMLKKEAFQLYTDVTAEQLGGVVKSQSYAGTHYACWLDREGRYACFDDDLDRCMGLQGSVCKHILVLLIGLTYSGELDPTQAYAWMRTAAKKGPVNKEGPSAELVLRYRGVEAGEVDWRPTETVPEDFYAL